MGTIGLDYDDTFTTNRTAWAEAMRTLGRAGFRIVGITFRHKGREEINDPLFSAVCDRIIYCGRHSKFQAAQEGGEYISIWIDDHPEMLEGGIPFERLSTGEKIVRTQIEKGARMILEGQQHHAVGHVDPTTMKGEY